MADVINKTTLEQRYSVNTPDYSTEEWIINPDLSALVGVAKKYWKVSGDTVVEMTTEEKATVNTPTQDQIKASVVNTIAAASAFGSRLTTEFAVENVLLGITQAGKTGTVSDYLHKLSHYIMTGSLYQAIAEIDTLIGAGVPENLSPFVTEERLLNYRSQIATYLGL